MSMLGRPRPPGSGRKKGTKNKFGTEVELIARKYKQTPFDILMMFANEDWKGLGYSSAYRNVVIGDDVHEVPVIDPKDRLKAAAEASKYLYPQRKSIEVKDENGNSLIPLVILPSNGREMIELPPAEVEVQDPE